jgi:hypothetical protein
VGCNSEIDEGSQVGGENYQGLFFLADSLSMSPVNIQQLKERNEGKAKSLELLREGRKEKPPP